MKKQISTTLTIILLLMTVTIANAQVIADKVEIRGDVSQIVTGGPTTNFTVNGWDATNFAGFWYDINKNKSTEKLNILKFKDNRTIDKNDLQYVTTRTSQKYKVFKEKGIKIDNGLDENLSKSGTGGYYAIVGWMAEKYVAINGKNNKISKLILDKSDTKTLQIGESWDLGEGYKLTAQSIDAKTTPRQAWLVLSKDDTKLDDKIIGQGQSYTYSVKSLAGETDVPVFVTYVDSVFSGQTSDMVQLKYTWLISDKVTEIKSGDKFGVFEVDTEQPLTLSNDASISLSRDSKVSLANNLQFKVADSDDNDIRFYPFVEIKTPGKYEIRGEVSQIVTGGTTTTFTVNGWDAKNFAGFWYDINGNKKTENLNILKFKDGRTIEKGDLVYSTGRTPQKYKVFKNKNKTVDNGLNSDLTKSGSGGYYALVGWMAEKYVAINGKNNKLSKLVLDQGATDKQTLQVGGTWELGEGYTLTAQSIDAKATPRQAWLILSKDGTKLDDKVSSQGDVYTYSVKSIAGETDVPIFVTYVDSIFSGANSDMTQLKYTWLISDNITEIKSGDKFGVFEVDSLQPLNLTNDVSISLSRDSTINIASNIKFKIADSDDNDVRFYPKIDYDVGSATTTSIVNETPVPTVTVSQTSAQITVTVPPPITTTAVLPPTETTPVKPVSTDKNKDTPGFEAIVAIVGLISMVYIVMRQKK